MGKVNFAQQVPIPADGSINGGLNPCGKTLLNHFGRPGPLRVDCSAVTNPALQKKLITLDVGPFNMTGLKPYVALWKRIFDKVEVKDPALYASIKTAGTLCCRLIRGSKSTFSIHSWGGATDLYCGTGIVPLGSPTTHLGVMRLYPWAHQEGLYWGAEFARNDAMHYEASRELVQGWISKKLI